jgi:hypothetical protein
MTVVMAVGMAVVMAVVMAMPMANVVAGVMGRDLAGAGRVTLGVGVAGVAVGI